MRVFVHILFVGVVGFVVAGCASEPEGAGAYREEFGEVFGSGGVAGAEENEAAWAIVVQAVSGRRAMERAELAASGLRDALGLESARVRERGNGAVVVYGGYDSPDDPAAQRDLERIKDLEVDGFKPFTGAFLSPQGGPDEGGIPELNLATARERHGAGAEYTLQIAVYESDDRGEAKRAAEQAAAQLRQEGREGFYFHGPTRSMVTVGLFGDRDYDPGTDRRSSRLLELQRQYPHNLLNGRTIIERRIGGERTQPSALVRVPGG